MSGGDLRLEELPAAERLRHPTHAWIDAFVTHAPEGGVGREQQCSTPGRPDRREL